MSIDFMNSVNPNSIRNTGADRGSAGSFLFGNRGKQMQFQNYTPQQQNVFNQMLEGSSQQLPQILQYLQSIISQDPEMMKQFEAPARRNFEENTIPSIAERFTSMGAQRSSAFGEQLGSAGAGLEENLAAQRGQMGSQAIQQLMALLQGGLTPQFENVYRPETYGFLGNLLSGMGQGAGQAASLIAGKQFGF